ncbi:MAG: hypothetical protein GY751_17030 [Bacteroidetes bacterium]|nr:hypothetical protein [Bacteroidota bacterium]
MKLLSLLLAFNVLIASTGLSLHTHSCSATETSVVNLTEKGCKTEKMKKMDCCAPSTDCGSQEQEDGCCSDEQQYYKEDLLGTISEKDQLSLPFIYPTPLAVIFEIWLVDQIELQHQIAEGLPQGACQSPPTAMLQVFRC